MKPSHGPLALRATARLTLATIAATTFSLPSFAADDVDLDAMTVTTNRMPSENLLAPTTVITRADIERLQINDLPTLLSRQPGIDMSVSGGIGKTSNIFMRGTSSGHVLLLVDGVKWHSSTFGKPSIQDFPIEQIERVEIVRGPRSGLYGSEAIGGVIQIFTRKGQQGLNPYAKVSYGTHNSKQAAVGVSGGNKNTTYSLSFNHQSTDGIDALLRDASDSDDDGYRNNSISARVQHKVNDKLTLGANFLRAEGFNEYDDFSTTADLEGESVQQVIGTNANLKINDMWSLALQLSESRDQSKNFENNAPDGVFSTRHRFVNVSNILAINPNHTINIGLDYEVDDISSTETYAETSRDNKAAFISWQANVDKFSWLLSARNDDNEAFGSYSTGTAEFGLWLTDGIQLTANVGTAYKAPTFNQLYFPDQGFFVGNPDLKPEKSKSYGLGLIGDTSWGHWGVQVYETKIRDLLTYVFPTTENVAEVKIKGIEFEVSTTLFGADIAADASFLNPEDTETHKTITYRAKRMANVHIDKNWGTWSAGASWKLSGHRYTNASNTNHLDGYGLVDIRASYQVAKDWSLQANVSNLFDKEYQTNNNYNSLDRVAMFTILYQPK